MSVGDRDVKWSSHEEVVRLTRAAGDRLTLRLASPMDQGAKVCVATHVRHRPCFSRLSVISVSVCSQSSPNGGRQSRSNQGSVSAASTSSGSTAAARPRRAPSWNPFKKNGARDNSQHRHANLVYR